MLIKKISYAPIFLFNYLLFKRRHSIGGPMVQRQIFVCAVVFVTLSGIAHGQQGMANQCAGLPNHGTLKAALDKATAEEKSGLNNHMWATIVDRDGVVCAVAFSGSDRGAQWGVSRVISAQKANTASQLALDSTSNSAGSRPGNRPRPVDRQPLLRRAAGWKPLWPAVQQSR